MSVIDKDPMVELARKVICFALIDATSKSESLVRREGRAFLLGSSPAWKNSLHDWCFLANISPDRITKKAKEWEENGWPTRKEIGYLIHHFDK